VDRIDIEEIDAEWSRYFRYGTIYDDQRVAIESFLDTLATRDYYLKEGACGTGKTLAAVTASVHAMRDPDQLADRTPGTEEFPAYDRTVVVTPVKQQLQQFIGELRGINATLPDSAEPIRTVVLRGQGDMRAINNTDLPGTDSREDIDDLRATTAAVIRFGSDIPLDWPDKLDPPPHSKAGYDWSDASKTAEQDREERRYDPHRARAVRILVSNLTPPRGGEYDRLEIDGVETPYPEHVPHSSELVDTDRLQETAYNQLPENLQGRFDPFYAAALAGSQGPGFRFADAPDHVVDRDALFSAAVADGRCPHELMGILAGEAEVILGNYNHLVDPETRRLTDGKLGLLDEQTIAVVDEAHQLEARSRDGLSTSLDLYTLDRALNDVKFARYYATGNLSESPTPGLSRTDARAAKEIARQQLGIAADGFESEDLIAVEEALTVARQELLDACEGIEGIKLGRRTGRADPESREAKTRPMAAPEHPEWGDRLTDAIEAHDTLSPAVLQRAESVMGAVESVYETLAERGVHDRTPQSSEVGRFLRQWAETPRAVYHPEARVQPSTKDSIPDRYPEWVRQWTPELRLFNCIPRRELRRVFAELGGGVLMSATLRPAEPFREAIGVDAVPRPGALDEETQDESSMTPVRANGITDEMVAGHETRSTTFDRFPLRFPPENRLSLVADLPKFTSKNRGSNDVYDPELMTDTRARYAALIRQVAQTEGNILVAMPSYDEAAWAYEFLEGVPTEKRHLLDKTSSADQTDELLGAFFADGDAVLCTSLRGTITEGVDFDGEKLHTCLSVGVPRVPPSPEITAVELAYKQAIESTGGLEAAHLIPSTRKVRQSAGRVIRGTEEAGVRILADERYGSSPDRNCRRFLSPQQQREFTVVEPGETGAAVERFWARQE
jgi:DEAD_2.